MPVTDLSAYDAAPRREEDVHAVADLMLSFRLTAGQGRGTFCIRATDGREDFEVRMRFDHRLRALEVYRGGELLARRGENRRGDQEAGNWGEEQGAVNRETAVTVSLVDRQFLLALDNRTLVEWPYPAGTGAAAQNGRARGSSTPFGLGAQGIDARIGQLRIYRDVYYASPAGLPAANGPVTLGADEYFLLGDNSLVSEDSRFWPKRGVVDGELLWAKPFLAVRLTTAAWGKCHFQVPDWRGIRYIP
jgi:signal peptidase I